MISIRVGNWEWYVVGHPLKGNRKIRVQPYMKRFRLNVTPGLLVFHVSQNGIKRQSETIDLVRLADLVEKSERKWPGDTKKSIKEREIRYMFETYEPYTNSKNQPINYTNLILKHIQHVFSKHKPSFTHIPYTSFRYNANAYTSSSNSN